MATLGAKLAAVNRSRCTHDHLAAGSGAAEERLLSTVHLRCQLCVNRRQSLVCN